MASIFFLFIPLMLEFKSLVAFCNTEQLSSNHAKNSLTNYNIRYIHSLRFLKYTVCSVSFTSLLKRGANFPEFEQTCHHS